MNIFKKIFHVITLSALFQMSALSQSDLVHMPSSKYFLSGKDSVMLSLRPVTNREYLLYIMWTFSVYGTDYPEAVFEAIPGLVKYDSTGSVIEAFTPDNNPFHALFRFCPGYVKNYMFNSKYADWPVIGVNWYQASKFLQWESDRYNEFTVIRKGRLLEDPNQMNSDCFVTEAYLAGQYAGATGSDEVIPLMWSDRLLIPAFRLPTRSEISTADKTKTLKRAIALYPYSENLVLETFSKYLLEVTPNKIKFKTVNGFEEEFKSTGEFETGEYEFDELTLDTVKEEELRTWREIFEMNGQPVGTFSDYTETEKDSSGHMPYIYVADDKDKMPVIVGKYIKPEPVTRDTTSLFFFRYACSIKSDRVRIK